jgi:hypothetical protein
MQPSRPRLPLAKSETRAAGRASDPPPSIHLNVDLAAEDLATATPPGHVFMFNMWKEDLAEFSVNGLNLGPIKGFSTPSYAPFNIAVPRTLNQSDGLGKFTNNGQNQVILQWSGDPITLPLIKITRPLSDDLLFYAFPFGFWLVTLDGEIKAQGFYQTDGVF